MNKQFEQTNLHLNGIDTAVFSAGVGDPVVFFHGGGTATGFGALLPIAEHSRLIVAHHPGFGSSGDPACTSVEDLARHQLDVLDAMDVDKFALVGHSMGGWTAATLASFSTRRLTRLVLAAPAGKRSAKHGMVDLPSLPPEDVLGYLAADLSIFGPADGPPPPPEFLAEREREARSFALLAWDRPFSPNLHRWLHRIDVPTLIVWGEADRLIPVGQATEWASRLPNSTVTTFPGVGHLLFDEHAPAVTAVADFIGS